MAGRLIVWACCLGALWPGLARAEPVRVTLVSADEALREAVAVALEPWSVEVAVAEAEPGAEMPAASFAARAVAQRAGATAVVWIATSPDGDSLWVYDARDDRTMSRPLSQTPPYDGPTAAAIALSIKALLRHSAAAPREEQRAVPAVREAPRGWLEVESVLGTRWLGADDANTEPRLGGALVAWPTPRFGAALAVRGGPGVAIDRPRFVGRFTDTALGAAARARVWLGPMRLEPAAGVTLHLTGLDGAVLDPLARAHVSRVDPSLDARLATTVPLSGVVHVGFALEGAYLLRHQRYLVQGETVFGMRRAEATVLLVLQLPAL